MKSVLYLFVIFTYWISNPAFSQSLEEILKAAEDGRTAEVATLLSRGVDVNTSDRDGNTLMILAARNRHRDLVALLLTRKSDVGRRNRYGDTALMTASLKGDLAVVKALVEAGADVNPGAGWNALHYAAFGGAAEVVNYLIGKGANKDAVAPNGYTPLMLAVRDGQVDGVKALLFQDADANFRNTAGETALMVAQKRERKDLVELLKRAGARE